MDYEVRGLDTDQRVVTLKLSALDEADARAQAVRQRVTPLSVRAARGLLARRGSAFSLLLFAQELHALVSAGLSVIETLDTLVERETHGDVRTVLARLAASLRQGERLSTALQQQPQYFPPLFAGIVQAAEGTSDLPRALARYIDYESRLHAVRHKVLSAIIYPVILLVVGGAVAAFLLGYVVPRFAAVYAGTGRPLPWASQLLLDWGTFASDHALSLVAIFVATVAVAVAWASTQLRDGGWWRSLSLIPGARARLDVLELSRLYLTLGMLLEGGIPVQRALQLGRSVLSRSRREAIDRARHQIEQGEAFSVAFAAAGLSTPVALRLLRVGERSGQLGEMLSRAAAFYEGETTRWLERFSKVFEPVLMAAIGLVIGAIVILLYMPVFDLAGSLQ
jgi:general secretion pathway protein F